jgi:hypothetical protein
VAVAALVSLRRSDYPVTLNDRGRQSRRAGVLHERNPDLALNHAAP